MGIHFPKNRTPVKKDAWKSGKLLVFYLSAKTYAQQHSKEEKLKTALFSNQAIRSTPSAGLRILATTDLHMNLTSFDYYADRPEPTIGFTRTASLIRAARSEAEQAGADVLLFDNGDSLQGTLLGDWAAQRVGREHPLMSAFRQMGYDAIALGNHDFGFGLPALDSILADAHCPVLCSNLQRRGPEQPWKNHAILTRNLRFGDQIRTIRIGVFSILPPQTVMWEAHQLDGHVDATDAVVTAKRTSAELRRQGCDLVLALAHSGIGVKDAAPMSENVVMQLADLDNIDVIVAGHTHLTVPDSTGNCLMNGKPVVMPGSAGSHLGVIDLAFAQEASGTLRIIRQTGHLRQISSVLQGAVCPTAPEDPDMLDLFREGHRQTRRRAARPVGQVDHPLHSYFSFCAPDRGLALVAAAQAAGLRPVLAESEFASLPVLSAVAPSKFGGRAGPRHYTEVAAGAITMRHVSDLHVFPNQLRAVLADGAQVANWLEMSAGLYNQLADTGESDLVDPEGTGHNFDVLYGVTYKIDLSQPARYGLNGQVIDRHNTRIRDLAYGGLPVRPDQKFVVAVNSYRASGGGHFPLPECHTPIPVPQLSIQNILRDYVSGRLQHDPLDTGSSCFTFVRHPGRTAILTTGPGAATYLHELDHFAPQILGCDARGFLQIRLSL